MITEKRINLRVTEEFHKRCEDEAWRRRTTLQQAGVTLFEQWLSGETTTPAKTIAPSTDVRQNTITAGLQVSIDRVPASLRPEFLAVLEAIADLLSKGLGSQGEGLQIDVRGEREEIDRRAEAIGEPALGVAGTEGPDIDTTREPTGTRRGKAKPK